MSETFSVTQTTNLSGLDDGDTIVDPGEIVTTTVTITNQSTSTDATGVAFTEVLNGMTLVDQGNDANTANDINVSPLAFDDSYNVVGNVTLTVSAANGVLGGAVAGVHETFGADKEFLSQSIGLGTNDTKVVTGTDLPTAQGGTVTIAADGSFTYKPPVGFTGTDTFTYTLRDAGLDGIAGNADDLSGSGTVSIDVGPSVWFIDNSVAGGPGDGSQSNPFRSIAEFNTANDGIGNHPAAGDVVYLATGTGTYTDSDGVNLLNGQTFIGAGEALTIQPTGGGNPVTIVAAGTAPVIEVTGTGEGVSLAQNNTLRGFDIQLSGAGTDGIEDGGGTVGTLTISNVAISGTGAAIDIDDGGTLAVTLDSISSTGADIAIDLDGVGGSFAVTGATTINDATVDGIAIGNSSVNATFGGKVTIVNDVGAGTVADGIDLGTGAGGANTGTYSFNGGVDVTVNGTNAFGVRAQSSGTVNISNDPGTTQITSVNGTALLINPTTLNASLDSITSGGGGEGISLTGMSGSLTVGTVSINGQSGDGIDITNSAGSVTINGGSIGNTNDPAGIGVDINGGTGNVTINAAITDTTAGTDVVEVSGRTTGTVDFNGLVTSTSGGGIDVNGNSGGTVRFDGGMNLSTGATTAFNSTGNTGMTLVVTDPGAGSNILTTTTGTALNVQNTTIGAEHLTFQSISTNGATNGIVLGNTGTTGGTHVTGTGAAGSGGTIQNTTGVGVSLTNTADVSLNNMTISNTGSHGVSGTGVTNVGNSGTTNNSFSFTNGLLDSPGDADNESALFFDTTAATNITGRMTVSGTTIQNFEDAGIILGNVSGSLVIDVTDTVFNNNSDTNGEEGIDVDASGTSNIQLNVSGTPTGLPSSGGFTSTTRFIDLEGGAINGVAQGSGTLDVNLSSVLITGTGGPDNFPTPPALTFSAEGSASTFTFDITNNRIDDSSGDGIFIGHEGEIEGRITGNTITNAQTGDGIRIDTDTTSNTTSTILIQNNIITNVGDDGIQVLHRDGTKTLNLVIDSNTIQNTGSEGVRYFADDDVAGGGPLNRLQITNNTFGNNGTVDTSDSIVIISQDPGTDVNTEITGNTGVEGITLQQSVSATLTIEQASTAALAAANGGALVTTSGTIGVSTAVTVPQPTNPLLAASDGVQAAPSDDETQDDQDGADQPADVTPPAGDTDDTPTSQDGGGSTSDPGEPPADSATPPTQTETAPSAPATHPVIVNDGVLSQPELDFFVDAAIARWTAAGLTDAQVEALQAMDFTVANLGGDYLGSYTSTVITLDADAAGWGWYLDETPLDDSEFGNVLSSTRMRTDPTGAPAGHYDLLTTVMHEMGHVLGLSDTYVSGDSNELMFGWLYLGERRIAGDGDATGAVAGSITSEEFLGGPINIGVLPAGKSVTIQWQATVDDQNNQSIVNPVNQGTVSATNVGDVGGNDGGQDFADTNSNSVTTTLDTVILGGTIWNDDGAGGGVARDGIRNGAEAGISGVALTLFADTGTTVGVWDAGDTQITTATTNGSGDYSFTGLAPGEYIVRVDQDNFDAGGNTSLVATPVSALTAPEPPDPDDNVDNDDNGARVLGQPAFSQAITLDYNTETTAGLGNDTNNTLDFGFAANPPPEMHDLGGDSSTFTEGGPAVAIDDSSAPEVAATVTDDQANFDGGSIVVSITANEVAGEDVLGISTADTVSLSAGLTVGSVVSVGGQAIGVITVAGSGGNDLIIDFNTTNATPAAVGTLINAFTYFNSNTANPSTLPRTLSVTLDDGAGGVDVETVTVNVTDANDAPVAVIAPATYSATEQVTLNLKNNGLSVSDVDAGSGNVTITLSVTEGTLTVSAGTSGVTIDSGNGTGSVVITGTVAQLNDFLNTNATSTLSYVDNTDTPAASATLTLSVNDNGNTGAGGAQAAQDTATINITAVNDAPNASMTTDPYAATEQTTLVLKGTGLSVSDVDSQGGVETITLSVGEGALTVAEGDSGVTVVSGNGTSAVQVSGTIAELNALLAAGGTSNLTYLNNSDTPAVSTTLTLQINDGGNTGTGGSLTGSDISTINITAVNDAPDANITPTTYGGQPGNAVNLKNNGLSVSDVDSGGGSETVTLSVTSGTLTVAAGTSGAGVAGSGTNSVTITGTIAQINALLNTDGTSTVSFLDAAGGSKTLTLAIDDNGNTGGGNLSDQDTATINLADPPVIAGLGGDTATFTEGGPSVLLDDPTTPATVTDPDSTDFDGGNLTAAITNVVAGEDVVSIAAEVGVLTLSNNTNAGSEVRVNGVLIGAVAAGGTGVGGNPLIVTFNANATPARVDVLMQHLVYSNLNTGDPDVTARSIDVSVDDGAGGVDTETVTVNVTAVNDGPVAVITPASYAATEQTVLNLKNNGLSVSDVDAGSGNVTITLSVTEGTLTVAAGTSGITIDGGNGTGSVVVSGTIAQLNDFLNTNATSTLGYVDNTDTPSATATLTLSVNDNGNTGTGGVLTNQDSATINIAAVNDAPVATITPPTYNATENLALDLKNNGLAVSDADGNAGSQTVTLSVNEGILNVTAGTSGAGVTGSGTGTVTITGTIAQINALLNTNATSTVSYVENDDSPSASVTLSLSINDNGNTGTGGALTGTDTATINITAVNDAPVVDLDGSAAGTGFATAFTESGVAVAIADSDNTIVDPDSATMTQAVVTLTNKQTGDVLAINGALQGGITSSIVNGVGSITVTLSGVASAADYADALRKVVFSNPGSPLNTVDRTVTVTVSDGIDISDIATTTIDIVPLNHAPAGTDKTVTTNEDVAYQFTAADFGFSDPDGNSLAAVKVTTLATAGTLTNNGVAVVAGQFISIADINAGKFKFTPALDANGTNYANFTFQVQDNGGTAGGGVNLDPTANTITINVTPVADVINGNNLPNLLVGTNASEAINGFGGNDVIYGLGGDDRLVGGLGADILIGGAGKDVFDFNSIAESAPGHSGYINNGAYGSVNGQGLRDIILDFSQGQDKIDVSGIDANVSVAGNQAFTWRGTGNFTGVAGQLIERLYNVAGTAADQTIIYGDVNGDARADFQIQMSGLKILVASDFVL